MFFFVECNITDAPATPLDASNTTNETPPYFTGDSISYTCNLLTHELNNSVVVCESDGNWSPSSIGSCMQTSKFLRTLNPGI